MTLLLAEREPDLRAAVAFAPAAASWDRFPALRDRLLEAVRRTSVPLFLIHAANDFSIAPGRALDAEMTRLGRTHELKIYPAAGRTPAEGHDFVHSGTATWEPDVFAFLDAHVRGRDAR